MNRLNVFIRVKPQDDGRSVIDIVDNQTLIFDPVDTENQPEHEYYYHGKKFKSIGAKKNKSLNYSFDRIFQPDTTNHQIFQTVTSHMVDATINGLNTSVFAYGATGSGKTFTMLGKPTAPGIIYYTARDIFEKLALMSLSDPLPSELKICYFEIYNEQIFDLLRPQNYSKFGNKRLRTTPERTHARSMPLRICESARDGNCPTISNLIYCKPVDVEQLIELVESGNANRSQHPTDANSDSSRSHAIFQILLTRRVRRSNSQAGEYELQMSKMSLIDLAGSERASFAYQVGTDRSKNLQREGGNINKSLLALGNCINALADPKRSSNHIPYRNSKLTRLLRDSLGGKCQTAMIATVSQHPNHYDDTQNTLAYASRAKCIKIRPERNFTDVMIQPKNYNNIIENQNRQIQTMQSRIAELELEVQRAANALPKIETKVETKIETKIENSKYMHQLDKLYEERRSIRLEILNYESKLRKNELKLAFKEMDEARHQAIHGELPRFKANSTYNITQDHSHALRTQLGYFERERQSLLDRARANEEKIQEALLSLTPESELRGCEAALQTYLCEKELNNELEEKKLCEQHAYDIAQAGINRLLGTEELLVEAAHVMRYIHAITKGRGLSDSSEAKISELFKKVDGKKSVIWKDDKFAVENERNDQPLSQLLDIHENFSLNFLTPHRNNNNTLRSRRISNNLVSLSNYTPEQNSNATFDASH